MPGKKGAKHFPQSIVLEMLEMHKDGQKHRTIAERFNLKKEQVKWFFRRYHQKERESESGEILKSKGRPRNKPITKQQELELRVRELEREVELYKSFLHAAGRR